MGEPENGVLKLSLDGVGWGFELSHCTYKSLHVVATDILKRIIQNFESFYVSYRSICVGHMYKAVWGV